MTPRELHLPTEPPVGASVEIRQGHSSSTFHDGGPWTRTSGGYGNGGGIWFRDRDVEHEVLNWHGVLRRWLDVHPYEQARLVVVDEGPAAASCPACSFALIAHTKNDSQRCLQDIANARTGVPS